MKTALKTLRIGGGAGYSGDRIEPALELAEHGDIDVLMFECLAERTIALAQQVRRKDPAHGYDPLLEARMRAVLPACAARGILIVTNMGAANPQAAAERTRDIARELGLKLRVAAVTGDDVFDLLQARGHDFTLMDGGAPVASLGARMVSANAYLGAQGIVDALAQGADVVITGRVADPALALGPLIHAFGWRMDDWHRLGCGTLAGHLLECAGQITGGYFADPGIKDVPDLARLGFPIGEVGEDGSVLITKVATAGGIVTEATCKEQLLYEIHDPARYLTPDVVADFSNVHMRTAGKDRVVIEGATGTLRTNQLKVSIGYLDSYIGEGQISYAGPNAVARGKLALDIVRERLALTGVQMTETRFELIGVDSLHGPALSRTDAEPYEVRVRVAARTESMAEAVRIGNEVETLLTCGPSGGGGATKTAREIIAVASTLIPAELAPHAVQILES